MRRWKRRWGETKESESKSGHLVFPVTFVSCLSIPVSCQMYSGDRLVLSVEPCGSLHTVLSKWGLVDSVDGDTTSSSRMSCPPLGNAEAICMLVSISHGLLLKWKIEFYKLIDFFFFKDNLNVFTDTVPFDSYIYMSWHSWLSFVRSKRCIHLTEMICWHMMV